ncbi:MAG: hypothetical protein HOP02_00435, partial [Methylococcaceae bacterium]|nr:hypothetical protein [Methylococcaceae bacterium]
MKSVIHLLRVLSWCLILTSVNMGLSSVAQADVSLNLFYRELAPYGHWYNHSTYGRVWQPRGVSRNWRPYTDGHWINTAQYGWYWQSDWDWGWAPFHYGRWAFDTFSGWIWIPGTVWAPAWVSWQYNNGYSAWAPLPPEIYWQPQSGLSFSYYSANRIPVNSWVVVPQQHFTHRHIHEYALPVTQNAHYINHINNTHNNISITNHHIVNAGVPIAQLEREQHHRVQTISAHETDALIAHQIRGVNGGINTLAPTFEPMSQSEATRERELAARVMRETHQQQAASANQHGFGAPIAAGLDATAPMVNPELIAPQQNRFNESTVPHHNSNNQQHAVEQQQIIRQQLEAQQQLEMQQQVEQQRQMEQSQTPDLRQQQIQQQQIAAQQQAVQQQLDRQQQIEQQRQMEIQQQAQQQIEMQRQAERQRQMEGQQQQAEQQRQIEIQQQAQQQQQQQMEMQQQQAEQQRQIEIQQQAQQ